MVELIVFANSEAARGAGFTSTGRHPLDEDIVAWWPGRGSERLRGVSISRVIVTEAGYRFSRAEDLERIRFQLRRTDGAWVQL